MGPALKWEGCRVDFAVNRNHLVIAIVYGAHPIMALSSMAAETGYPALAGPGLPDAAPVDPVYAPGVGAGGKISRVKEAVDPADPLAIENDLEVLGTHVTACR